MRHASAGPPALSTRARPSPRSGRDYQSDPGKAIILDRTFKPPTIFRMSHRATVDKLLVQLSAAVLVTSRDLGLHLSLYL